MKIVQIIAVFIAACMVTVNAEEIDVNLVTVYFYRNDKPIEYYIEVVNSVLKDKFQYESVIPISPNAFKDYLGVEIKLVPVQEELD